MFSHIWEETGTELGIYEARKPIREMTEYRGTKNQLALYNRSSSSMLMASILFKTYIAGT